jgi:hypothetical protein
LNCTNFEDSDGIPICARHHRPGIACGGFNDKKENGKSSDKDRLPVLAKV